MAGIGLGELAFSTSGPTSRYIEGIYVKNIAKALVIAAAVPALVMTASGAASADGWVSWTNNNSNLLLQADFNGTVKGAAFPSSSSSWSADWFDTQNSDGSWNEANGASGGCLVGYYRQVYTEACHAYRDGTNSWQRWSEISTNTGWKLQNRQTGYVLDDAGSGGIYANEKDWNNSNQRWR
ncbi:hypothetical protein ACFYMW_25235 [Streptomyces sp. NPDC006692]|uniref:hypothetical protein n=1 Tax=Streptomyces sp. NPDC006692 TaxID=3364758 RepID=UPI0036B112F5